MQVLRRIVAEEDACEYLPEQLSRLEYLLVADLKPEEYEDRMNLGWRKFGPLLFHPTCRACSECRPIRIPIATFAMDRSQRRAVQRNEDLVEVRFAVPSVDPMRLALYNRYHQDQHARKDWPYTHKTAKEYTTSFLHNPIPAIEISVWEGDALRAVVLTDITPNVVSGVYHYHDPDLRDRSIGVFAMLQTIELARRLERAYAYFGYYVAGCGSLSYKARFRPCEILDEDNVWREFRPVPKAAGRF